MPPARACLSTVATLTLTLTLTLGNSDPDPDPNQVVVIGDESSGKSTVLEQLFRMPLYPRKKTFCTRLPIHVRLRRPDAAQEECEYVSACGSHAHEVCVLAPSRERAHK